MRQIVLDTETTGLDPKKGHRIIEIGCVELIDRRATGNDYHQYIQPDREIDPGAVEVHGITNEFLADKPRFGDIVEAFMAYVKGAELIIHNAPFDVGFIDAELERLGGWKPLAHYCTITDTLVMAREQHPGKRNSLDALCSRYGIDNSHRQKHGALLDAEILADVYLAMTAGQETLALDEGGSEANSRNVVGRSFTDASQRPRLRIIRANAQELQAHREYLQALGEHFWD